MQCRFCVLAGEAADTETAALRQRPENTVLLDDDACILVPALGYFSRGYCLLISHEHAPSVASLEDAARMWEQSWRVQCALSRRFGAAIAFEHGARGPCERSGSCIEHAHIHLLPLDVPNIGALVERCGAAPLSSEHALRDGPERPYVWLRDHEGRSFVRDGQGLPSQYVRRSLASLIGLHGDVWDWRRHGLQDRLTADLPDLIRLFASSRLALEP